MDGLTDPEPQRFHTAGVEIGVERDVTWVALVRAVPGSGRVLVHVLNPIPGTAAAAVIALWDRYQVDWFGIDPTSPSATLVQPLTDAGMPLKKAAAGDIAAANGTFMDWTGQGRVMLRGHPALEVAAQAAQPRKLRDQIAVRRYGGADMGPLMAAELGCWALGDPDDADGIAPGVWAI